MTKVPKSAQSTLKDYAEIVEQLLSNEAVKEQMSELKIQIGDNHLPVNVEANITTLQKLMGDVRSYGRPRLSWGSTSLAARGTHVGLGVDFKKDLLRNLGRVEVTKRRFRELLTARKGSLRGAIIVLAYDSEEVNNRVRVAAKQDGYTTPVQALLCSVQQVSVQIDFPIQCCKIETLRNFKKGEDKSFNIWWNVFIQFQTKIIERKFAGVPWVADDLLAPIKEEVGEQQEGKEKLAVSAAVGIVGARNVEHTQFISHIGASAPASVRAGVVRDIDKHFQSFWGKFCKHLREAAQPVQRGVIAVYRVPPVHLILYRSSPSGSAQAKEVLAQEIAPIRTFLEAELGKFSFCPETQELTFEHPMVTAFPGGKFYLRMQACPAAHIERCKHKAEELGTQTQPTPLNLTCDKAQEGSNGRFALKFKLGTGMMPYYGRHALLTCTKMTNPETYKLEAAGRKKYILLPNSHPILKYARANSRWLANIAMQFTADPKEPASIVSPDTGMREEKFLIGTADPTRGSPSASEFQIISNSEFDVEREPAEEPVPQDNESPEEGEEPELQERRQKRRHEGGWAALTSGHSELLEHEAGKQNLEELKAGLHNRDSVLMTTAFML
ncbi:hypothetical protein ACSSS7_001150 [Eimeria intestinalis]